MSADLSLQPAFGGDRLLYACIGFSMLVHVAVMWRAPHVEPREVPPPRITATLRQAEPAPPPPVAVAAPPPPAQERLEPPKPPPAEARQAAPAERSPQKSKPDAPPVARVEPIAPLPAAAAAPAPAPATAPAAPAAPATAPVQAEARPDARAERQTEKPAAAVPAPASPEFSDRALIDLYQSQIASIIETRRLKRYPSEAMQNNWEGTATVVLKIGTDGKVAGVETGSSSGHEMLDEQARISLSKAKPFVQIPEGLKGKAFDARVRVVFSLAK